MSKSKQRWNRDDRVVARELTDIRNERVSLPDRDHLVHLQFRRFAGCPVCDLHLRSIVRRNAELTAASVREVVVFHSSAAELREYDAHELPFAVVADPSKRLYAEFGVDASPRSIGDPRAWWPILRAIGSTLWLMARGKAKLRAPSGEGGRLGLPAEFLVARDGRVLASKYGEHAYDQWSVDRVLEIASANTVGNAVAPSLFRLSGQ